MSVSSPSPQPSVLPNIRAVRPILLHVLDHQLSDQFNFDLPENIVSALSAFCTAASMLLLADIVYRLIVRARDNTVDSHAVHRAYLLARATNPIILSAWLRRHAARGIAHLRSNAVVRGSTPAPIPSSSPCDPDDERDAALAQRGAPVVQPSAFPRHARIFIVIVGALLVFLEVMFVFLSTNITTDYPIDKRQFAALTVRDDGGDDGVELPPGGCVFGPITETAHFLPQASQFVCMVANFLHHNTTWTAADAALAQVAKDEYGNVLFVVTTARVQHVLVLLHGITMGNLTDFYISDAVTGDRAAQAIPFALRRRGLSVQRVQNINADRYNGALFLRDGMQFMHAYEIGHAGLTRPSTFVQPDPFIAEWMGESLAGGLVTNESLAWNSYIFNATTSVVHFDGRAGAFNNELQNVYLDEGDEVLVKWQRPRLSLGAAIMVCGALFVAWLVLVFALRWRSGFDHRVAWDNVFEEERGIVAWDEGTQDRFIDVEALRGGPRSAWEGGKAARKSQHH